jgi:hypothetical protein
MEETAMAKDDQDLLELLKEELVFIEQGGYGRSVRTPWKATSTFQDSLSCLNYAVPYRVTPCNECRLINFVSPEDRMTETPCHHIQLNAEGDTIADLELADNQHKLEEEVKDWLRQRIKEIEDRTQRDAVSTSGSPESHFCCQS